MGTAIYGPARPAARIYAGALVRSGARLTWRDTLGRRRHSSVGACSGNELNRQPGKGAPRGAGAPDRAGQAGGLTRRDSGSSRSACTAVLRAVGAPPA
jgi:hypothetical protein